MAEIAIHTTLRYKTTTCITCGVEIALVQDFYDWRVRDQKNFYCPSGHPQHFIGETEEAALRKKLDRLQKEKEWAEQSARRAQEAELKAKRKLKRVANGVCPCCKRHFTNVERHVKSKHPDFGGAKL